MSSRADEKAQSKGGDPLNGRRAKALRRRIYGDHSIRPSARTYRWMTVCRWKQPDAYVLLCAGLRADYQQAKKSA
jgi:hypothetical protein